MSNTQYNDDDDDGQRDFIIQAHLCDALLPSPAALTLLAPPPDEMAAPLKSSPPVVLVHADDSTTDLEEGAEGLAQSGSPYWPLMVVFVLVGWYLWFWGRMQAAVWGRGGKPPK